MPATSIAQRQMMAIAEKHPEQLYARNRNVLRMSKGQMHDYASTKENGLPLKKEASRLKKKKKRGKMSLGDAEMAYAKS